MPLKASIAELGLFADLNLYGKLVFYQRGFIFVDQKLNSFVLSYDDIEHINFYVVSYHSLIMLLYRLMSTGLK